MTTVTAQISVVKRLAQATLRTMETRYNESDRFDSSKYIRAEIKDSALVAAWKAFLSSDKAFRSQLHKHGLEFRWSKPGTLASSVSATNKYSNQLYEDYQAKKAKVTKLADETELALLTDAASAEKTLKAFAIAMKKLQE